VSVGTKEKYALILGSSSGFGGATAVELARSGFNIFGVHLDTRTTLPNAQNIVDRIRAEGRAAEFFNINAADPEKRGRALDQMSCHLEGRHVGLVLHSLAFGTLKSYVAEAVEAEVTPKQMDMTLDVMANSLVYWVQDLLRRDMLGKGSKVFAMTSAGSSRMWPTYGPVSAAKAALESHVRQLAFELAPKEITVNAIRAGVTHTPALEKIPGHDELLAGARARNPSGRLTTPGDVGSAIAALSDDRSYWITGNVIGVDGGEDIVG
jgi:NAD(P)-dependent dehydrogenase (short-subunit alcohol dehydrogenase family)